MVVDDHGNPTDDGATAEVLFTASVVPTAIADAAGTLYRANVAFCTLLALPEADLVGRPVQDLLSRDPRGAALPDWLGPTEQPGTVSESWFLGAAGQQIRIRRTATAVRGPDGQRRHIIVQLEDLTDRDAAEEGRHRNYTTDDLTGLVNRRLFYQQLTAALTHPRRASRRLAVLVVNLNRFHQVNAGLGHLAADDILVEVARRLVTATGRQDTVSRLGGDWFAIVARAVRTPHEAVARAVAVRHAVGEPYSAAGNAVFVSARVGVVCAPDDGTDAVTLLRRATAATRLAKLHSSGWAKPAPGQDEASRNELGLVSGLQTAIGHRDISVAYQPIVDVAGALHSVEALARWQHPTRGHVPPDQFIVLAEQYGLIGALTEQILAGALEQSARWAAEGVTVPIAVNLSGKLLAGPDLVNGVTSALAAAALPPAMLTLEITETAFADGSIDTVFTGLDALRKAGVHIAIDDFGTGYSSLGYLRELPVDELKIDRSFITDLVTNDRAERVVRSIIDLAHSLDLVVVAEGVEDDAAGTRLLELGVDFLQGYGIARPANNATITSWLKSRAGVAATSGPARGPTPRRLHVLVVDDHVSSRTALRHRLVTRNHRVVEANSGHAAFAKLKAHMPDVVILDHQLPGMTGVEAVPQLRAAGYAGPIVLYSASRRAELASIRLPLDVWPVSKADDSTLLALIDGYAARPVYLPQPPA
jgi:diguanylate cyclase (GGDEF)-like protein/PAS domain S-box-containing protein